MTAKNRDPRSEKMAALYQSGKSLREVGHEFGLTSERVRQLISQDYGLTRTDGGAHHAATSKKVKRRIAQDKWSMEKHGCSYEQYRRLAGVPTRRFNEHRNHARFRGVEWKMNLWEWWTIWQQSGKWDQRGSGQGYVMCRKGDLGPYAVGNVFIAPSPVNCSEGQRKNSDLPIGVRRRRDGFSANRMVDGVRYYLGSFTTAEKAGAAYLAAGPASK